MSRTLRTDKMHPLPWSHKTDGKKMSAVIDAEGCVVCGSLLCWFSPSLVLATKARQTHAFIVKFANKEATDE